MTRLMIKLTPEWRPDRDRNALTFILSEQKSENGHVAVSKRGAPSRYAIGVASMWPILGVGPIARREMTAISWCHSAIFFSFPSMEPIFRSGLSSIRRASDSI